MNFLNKIDKYASNACLIDDDEKVFLYEDIIKTSEKISEKLKERSLILVLAQNDIEFISGYIGFFRKRLIQMIIDSKIKDEFFIDLIKKYLPSYIFMPILKNTNLKDYQLVFKLKKYKILKLKKIFSYSINSNLALLLSTSGSTGSKKFVKISHENIYDNTKNIIQYLKINQTHRTVTTMPPYYTYGLSIINTHLQAGASIYVTNKKVIEKNFWKLLSKKKITSFGGVPYFYQIIKKLNFNRVKISNLKYFTQAGGPLDKESTKYFSDYAELNGAKFIIMYGQAEATSRMTYLSHDMCRKKIGSIGKPIPGGKIFLKNNTSTKSTIGEIIYQGKNVSMGYAQDFRDLGKGDENKGILNTGDLAFVDKDGYYYITGRKSRNIKLYGHRINLDEIEEILKNKGYDCLCSGIENKVTIFHKNKKYNSEIIKYLSKLILIHSSCFKLKYLKKFPMNENGKISYKNLEKFL